MGAIRPAAAGPAAAAGDDGVVRRSVAPGQSAAVGLGGGAGPRPPQSRRLLQQQDDDAGSGPGAGADIASWLAQLLRLPFFGAQPAPAVVAAPPPTGPLPQLPPAGFGDAGGTLTSLPPAPAPAPRPPAAAVALAPPAARAAAPAEVDADITIAFVSTGVYGGLMRVPSEPRTMSVVALRAAGGEAAALRGVPYAELQTVRLRLPVGERYTLEIRDEADEELLLFQSDAGAVDATAGAPLALGAAVRLQPLELQARFTRLAWSGGLFLAPNESAQTNIAVIGAKLALWTRGGGLAWSSRYTDEEGLALFFVVPGSAAYWANFTLGAAQLASARLDPVPWQGDLPGAGAVQPPVQPVDTERKLLCTGDLDEVRAPRGQNHGSFPPNNAAGAYTPLNFACRWAIVPPSPSLVTLDVDYSTLLPGESLILYLDPSSTVVLTPGCCGPEARFQTAVVVDGSLPVEFRTGNDTDRRVGGFRIDWYAQERGGGGGGGFQPQEVLIIVLSVAASSLLGLAFCAYCSRRRRRIADFATGLGPLPFPSGPPPARNCPTPVRGALPRKPYTPPEKTPLPGAGDEGEPDCCSICLVEFEGGEEVTVLPCRHFYHVECIDGWLKRNCTCCLCKSDVLTAIQALAHDAAAAPQPPCRAAGRGQRGRPPLGVQVGAGAASDAAGGADATVSVIISPRPPPCGAFAAPAAADAEACGGVEPAQQPLSRAASHRSTGLPLSPGRAAPAVVQAGRADATADDFRAAARAMVEHAAAAAAGNDTGAEAAASRAASGRSIELPRVSGLRALSWHLRGALRGAQLASPPSVAAPRGAAAGGGAELALELPGSVGAGSGDSASAAAVSPAAGVDGGRSGAASPAPLGFPPRVVNIYAYAGRGTSNDGRAPSPPTEPQPVPQPVPRPARSSSGRTASPPAEPQPGRPPARLPRRSSALSD
ncbi:hypothetical protein Rsub_06847 [Raphidocelis subcapitata]|uniref:RING-type domain-containing protein n=1 Tax=Raphidocelis subcapitata TaxID=307507 RepID=A0A2V0P1U4_9CHLO|nr:hypothetical protein Rsub_06847 [Raphidocelis subcapitata]|eukprot:GBF93848.1 hypothetical protein Rsub_06847 [Raphidocelis subcapitata]